MLNQQFEENNKLKEERKFLIEREKKLQLIEQIYKNNPVDLSKLSNVIREEK